MTAAVLDRAPSRTDANKIAARRSRHRANQAAGQTRMCAKGLHDMYEGELLFTTGGSVRCRPCKQLARRNIPSPPLQVVEEFTDGWRELFPEGIRNLWQQSADDWHEQSLCHIDPELFFTPDTKDMGEFHRRNREAKAICRMCPVRSQCLEYALAADEEYGIWGGMTPPERRRLKENRAERELAVA